MTSDDKTKSSIATADTIVISAGGNEILRPLIANILAVADAADLQSFGEALAADKEGKLVADIQAAVAVDQTLRTAADTAVTNIAEALVSVSAMNPEADILILTIYNPFSGIPGLELISGTSDEVLTTINNSIFAAADAINKSDAGSVSVIDVASLFNGKAALYTNIISADIHPNANGHNAIYGLLAGYAPVEEDVAEDVTEDDDIAFDDDFDEEAVTEDDAADDTVDDTDSDVAGAADSAKGSPDTGVADVAAVAGIAILAVGAAVIAKKKN
ncbi:MAG: hypothetical protein J6X60_03070 [Ruminiclostridium sp.]|nr:hypothetical protein [Ruminiclostridium sp.]